MGELNCEVCGNELTKIGNQEHICNYCRDYHAPDSCGGEGCKTCADIKWMRKVIAKDDEAKS